MDCAAAMGKFHGSDVPTGWFLTSFPASMRSQTPSEAPVKIVICSPCRLPAWLPKKSPARFRQLLAPGDGKFNAKSAWPREWVDGRL